MGRCYAEDAGFSDPVFPGLDAAGVRAMWKMLLTSGTDLRVTFTVLEEDAVRGICTWEAYYTFGRTGRKVHNRVHSTFQLRDGLIYRQQDRFNFWRWSIQALGPKGMLLGWSPWVRKRVISRARAGLDKVLLPG